MPIRAEMRVRYPENWPTTSKWVRFTRAGGRCECDGRCGAVPHDAGRCTAVHNQPHPVTESPVTLTTAHLDHVPENCDLNNLMAMCQRCHLAYDKAEHAANASHTRALRAAGDTEPLIPYENCSSTADARLSSGATTVEVKEDAS